MKSHKTIKVGLTCRACGNVIKAGSKHFDLTGEACWEWSARGGHVCRPLRQTVDLDDVGVHDLVYDNRAWDDIKARFPQATKQNASDEIHEDRISVDIPEVPKRDWYQFLLQKGWAGVSLWFGLDIHMGDKAFLRQCYVWMDRPIPQSIAEGA